MTDKSLLALPPRRCVPFFIKVIKLKNVIRRETRESERKPIGNYNCLSLSNFKTSTKSLNSKVISLYTQKRYIKLR